MLVPAVSATARAGLPDPSLLEPIIITPPDTTERAPIPSDQPPSFVVHRVANPRYRPPSTVAAPLGPGMVSQLRALDHFGGQVFHHDPLKGGPSMSEWQAVAGEQYRDADAVDLSAAGEQRGGVADLRALRLAGRFGDYSGGAGDLEQVVVNRMASLQRLRGGVFRYAQKDATWMALGGGPTPVPGARTPPLAMGGVAAQDLHYQHALVSLSVMGFGRGATTRDPLTSLSPDTLPGRGVMVAEAWSTPVARGALAGTLGGQVHDLNGPQMGAVYGGVEWNLVSPTFAATLASERATRGTRLIGTDRFSPAAQREDRWALQSWLAGKRAESHFTGVLRDGGDPTLETHTVTLGASGSFGRSAWYAGSDAVWDERRPVPYAPLFTENRLSVHAGGPIAHSGAFQSRLEYGERPHAAGSFTGSAEASLPLQRGVRHELEPRVGWSDHVFEQAQFTTRLSWPLTTWNAYVTGSLAIGAQREQAFQGRVSEAAISFSFAPRPRDRGEVEIRTLDPQRSAAMEYSASYDAIAERYDTLGGWTSPRDTARILVRVVRGGNGSGASEVLVSLDGSTLRFTDADGVARFDHVAPGIHTVAVEERSLPENVVVTGSSRAFVTVERDHVADPVTFTIQRAERRTKF